LPIQKVTPPRVPFVVSLHRWPRDGFPLPFVIQHSVAGDVEAKRRERIETAYNRKVPKLLQWKKSGAQTILILEEDDIFLTNHFNVADALAEVEASRTDRPDEIYLLSVFTSMWLITRLRSDCSSLYDLPIEDRFWEVRPSTLADVTGHKRAA
jgi:hypothetical protein